MEAREFQEKIRGHIERLRPKHYRTKLAASALVLLGIAIGLSSQFFVSLGVFDISHKNPSAGIAADAFRLESVGFNTEKLEQDINALVAGMNNAQQGTHFLLGMISGLIFSQPLAGLTVGLIKETYDFVHSYEQDLVGAAYFADATIDTIFWLAGGFVGFYILSAVYDIMHENGIHGPRGLLRYVGRTAISRLRRKKS